MEAQDDYIGKINLAGEIFDYDARNKCLRGIAEDSPVIYLSFFHDDDGVFTGYFDRVKKVVSRWPKLGTSGPGSYVNGRGELKHIPKLLAPDGFPRVLKVQLPHFMLDAYGKLGMEEIDGMNRFCISREFNVVMIDDRLNRVLRGALPQFSILEKEYEYSAEMRTFLPLDPWDMPLHIGETAMRNVMGMDIYSFDPSSFQARSTNYEEMDAGNVKYMLSVPTSADPFYDPYWEGGKTIPPELQMLSVQLPDPVVDVAEVKALKYALKTLTIDTAEKIRLWMGPEGYPHQIDIHGTFFHADFELKRWVDNQNPRNVIYFDAFSRDNDTLSSILFDRKLHCMVLPEHRERQAVAELRIPTACMDPQFWENPWNAEKANRKYEGLGFHFPGEDLRQRIVEERLPVLLIGDDQWEVNVARMNMRCLGDTSKVIEISRAPGVLLYNNYTREDDFNKALTATELQQGWMAVSLPPHMNLDPVGYARLRGLDDLYYVHSCGIRQQQKADVIPLEKSMVVDMININRKKKGMVPLQKTGKAQARGKKRGKGI